MHVYYYDYLWLIWTHWILKAKENLDSHSYINSLMMKLKYFTWVLGEIRANHNSIFNTVTSSLPEFNPDLLDFYLLFFLTYKFPISYQLYLLLFVPSSHYNGEQFPVSILFVNIYKIFGVVLIHSIMLNK